MPENLVSVAICDTQPLTVVGVRAVLAAHSEFDVTCEAGSLTELRILASRTKPRIAIMDKAALSADLPGWLSEFGSDVATVVWGATITEPEALRMIQGGVRGVLRKTATAATLLACLRAVAQGQAWMEDSVVRAGVADERYPRSELTPRERQVMELVEHGMKNRDIADELGIRPGTVKIHLKHIFEKTGVRGRYGLALSGLRHRGVLYIANGVNGNGNHTAAQLVNAGTAA